MSVGVEVFDSLPVFLPEGSSFITFPTPWPDPSRKPLSLVTCHEAPWPRVFASHRPHIRNPQRRTTTKSVGFVRHPETITFAIPRIALVKPAIESKRWWHIYDSGYRQYNTLLEIDRHCMMSRATYCILYTVVYIYLYYIIY